MTGNERASEVGWPQAMCARLLCALALCIGAACGTGTPSVHRITTAVPVGWLGPDSLVVQRLDRLGDGDALTPSCDSSGLWLIVGAQSPKPHSITERLCGAVFNATGSTLSRDGRQLYFADANWDGRIVRFDIAADSSEIVFEHECLAVPGEAAPSEFGVELLVLTTCGPEASRRAWRVRPPEAQQLEPFSASVGEAASSLSWAPGDSQVAFAMRFEGAASARIFVSSSDGQLRRELVEGDSPSWSPQGDWIAFISTISGPTEIRRLELISSDGARRRVLATTLAADSTDSKWSRAAAGPLRWSPDGSALAFYAPCGVGVARVDGSGVREFPIGSAARGFGCG